MKKSAKIFLIAIALITAALTVFFGVKGVTGGNNASVSENIIKAYDKEEGEDYVGMKLSDYTDFEWDYVVIYKFPTTAEDISKKALVDYTTENDLSLTSGMIFVNTYFTFSDGSVKEDITEEEFEADPDVTSTTEIVYEETFETDYNSPYRFVIYPEALFNGKRNVVKINRADALFDGKRQIFEGENRYYFYPHEKEQ